MTAARREPKWLPETVLLAVHDRQVEIHGGPAGIRDTGLFQSAIARPINAWVYGEDDLCTLADWLRANT